MFNFTSFKSIIIIIIKYIFLSILALLTVAGGESDNGRKGERKLGWGNLQVVKMQKKVKIWKANEGMNIYFPNIL